VLDLANDICTAIHEFKRSELDLMPFDGEGEGDDGGGDGDDDDDGDRPPLRGPQLLKGRPQIAAPTVRVTSLRTALEAALEAGGSPRNVIVASVHLCHATAIHELLRYEDMRHGWRVLNPGRTNAAVLADNTLRVICAGILPSLAEDPTGNRYLAMLRRYADQVKRCAESLGGSSRTNVSALADLLLHYIGVAGRHPAVDVSALVASSNGFLTRIANLRSQQVTILEDA
jgi:hypothetical protein